MHLHHTQITADVQLYHIGPALDAGPLPSVFYFSLNAKESLGLDPYNQPALFLAQFPIRVFSLTLPGHEDGKQATQALHHWATSYKHHQDVIDTFLKQALVAIEYLHRHDLLLPGQTAVAGLSRGAFIASHLAARSPLISHILGFAPLTALSFSADFAEIKDSPVIRALDLNTIIPQLVGKTLRFYIGNHDTLVSTAKCFQFVDELSQASYKEKIRSPQVELNVYPSIGHKGHGTPKEIFHSGALWLTKKLGFPNHETL